MSMIMNFQLSNVLIYGMLCSYSTQYVGTYNKFT